MGDGLAQNKELMLSSRGALLMLPKTLNEETGFSRGIDRKEGDLIKEGVLGLGCARYTYIYYIKSRW